MGALDWLIQVAYVCLITTGCVVIIGGTFFLGLLLIGWTLTGLGDLWHWWKAGR